MSVFKHVNASQEVAVACKLNKNGLLKISHELKSLLSIKIHKWFLEALHHIQKRIKNINIKSKPWGWRGGSKVKSIDCSCREHRFQSQHPYCSSQPSVPPILEEVILLVISVGMRHT